MNFTSYQFLLFFPCVFLLYWALPFKYRKYMLLVSSYYFYMCWRADYIFLILLSTGINYFCSLGIEKYRKNKRIANMLLTVSTCMSLGLLFIFKYFNFATQSLNALFHLIAIPFSAPVLNIILPVGISFYTFQTMSYTIDVWRGRLPAERDFVTFALFVSYFPQLVAGPIEKATNLLPQLKEKHKFSYENATYGLKLMAWGYFKKLVIADRLGAMIVDPVYNSVQAYSGGGILLATVAFAIQIYGDFSGYSDIARGCAKTMGIELTTNFRNPYLYATSIGEFWQRWHISLSSWLSDYVYSPVAMKIKRFMVKRKYKGGKNLPTYTALALTFFLSGLWHGASWTCVMWGILHAAFRLTGTATLKKRRRLYKKLNINTKSIWFTAGQTLFTFLLVCFTYVFFRANSMGDAVFAADKLFEGVLSPAAYLMTGATQLMNLSTLEKGAAILEAFALCILTAFDAFNEKHDVIKEISSLPYIMRWAIYSGFMVMLLIMIPKANGAQFIYFQF